MTLNCKEQVLDDVVRVELVEASACNIEVPSGVPGVVSVSSPTFGTAALSLSYKGDDSDTGEMGESPTLAQSDERQLAGVTVKHELQVPVVGGFDDVRAAVYTLFDKDFNVVLTTDSAERYLLYAVPNGSMVVLDETDVNQESALKVSIVSMSHIIRIE